MPDFNADQVAQGAFNALQSAAVNRWHSAMHIATAIPALGVFEDYFGGKPPFGEDKSKEFPDAFVVKALEKWCRENGCKMYVVTRDKAMTDAVKATDVLLPMRTLDELLAAQAATETPDARVIAEQLLDDPRVAEQIQSEVERNLEDLIPIYGGGDYAEGEVSEHESDGEIEFDDFSVIAVDKKEIRPCGRI